jgi:tripartite ATP-independent transporter DctM subunit
MSDWQIGIMGLISLLVLIPLGIHISVAMGLVALVGITLLNSLESAIGIVSHTAFTNATSYMLAIIPMFMLMGEFANTSGLIEKAYRTIHKWLGHLPGGLSMAAIGGCSAFAAVCGSSSATAVVMVSVSLKEMTKHKYWPGLSLGSLGAGGTLGILIPPSSAFVLYGIITEQSIGKLFLAGIIPGIMLTLLFWISIYVVCKRNPVLGPAAPKSSWKERIFALKDLGMIGLLFGVVMGGIYFGVFTPTEAAGVGVTLSFFIALFQKKVTRKSLRISFLNSLRATGMVFAMIVGAMAFNYFLTLSGLTIELAEFVTGLEYSPMIIMIIILLLYLALGCLMDPFAMLLIVVPILFPIIMDLGFDPIWFGVVSVIMMEMGLITPPVGLNIFIMAGMAKDIPISTMYKGITPFVIAIAICVALLVIFPNIALFIPYYLK